MIDIAVIGAGGFGFRHVQSCVSLPPAEFTLHVVDPSAETRERVTAAVGNPDRINWHTDPSSLPRAIGAAVVATRADIRAEVIQALLAQSRVRGLILEKVLFQKLADYATVGALLRERGVAAYVNCTRRVFPAYRRLKATTDRYRITRLSASGHSWDLGCNGIHILDLFAFLVGGSPVPGLSLTVGDIKLSKRAGMLHVDGRMEGALEDRKGQTVPFEIESSETVSGPISLVIETEAGRFDVTEGASVTIRGADGSSTDPVPPQSTLSAGLIQRLATEGSCDLTPFDESRALHEPFVAAVLAGLAGRGVLVTRDVCPIT